MEAVQRVQFTLTALTAPEVDGRKCHPVIQSVVQLDPSVHLDHTVDLCNEPETGKEADGS